MRRRNKGSFELLKNYGENTTSSESDDTTQGGSIVESQSMNPVAIHLDRQTKDFIVLAEEPKCSGVVNEPEEGIEINPMDKRMAHGSASTRRNRERSATGTSTVGSIIPTMRV